MLRLPVGLVAEVFIEEQVYKNLVKKPLRPRIAEKHNDPLPTHWKFDKYAEDMYALAKHVFPGDDPVWRYTLDIFLQSLAMIVKEQERGQENATRDPKENRR
jgi:hypothetical protein